MIEFVRFPYNIATSTLPKTTAIQLDRLCDKFGLDKESVNIQDMLDNIAKNPHDDEGHLYNSAFSGILSAIRDMKPHVVPSYVYQNNAPNEKAVLFWGDVTFHDNAVKTPHLSMVFSGHTLSFEGRIKVDGDVHGGEIVVFDDCKISGRVMTNRLYVKKKLVVDGDVVAIDTIMANKISAKSIFSRNITVGSELIAHLVHAMNFTATGYVSVCDQIRVSELAKINGDVNAHNVYLHELQMCGDMRCVDFMTQSARIHGNLLADDSIFSFDRIDAKSISCGLIKSPYVKADKLSVSTMLDIGKLECPDRQIASTAKTTNTHFQSDDYRIYSGPQQ